MEVLYAEVKSRTMEPAHVDTSGVKPQTDCKSQGISSCCQSTPETKSAPAAQIAAVPAEHAEPAGHAVSQHTQGQAVAIAAEVDAREAPQDTASLCNSSANDKLQHPESTSGTSSNIAVSTEQSRATSKAGIPRDTDRPADSKLRAASLTDATAQQADITDGAAAHSVASDGAQRADVTDGPAAHSVASDDTQQADIADGPAASSVASDDGGCGRGQIAGYTWTLPAGVQQEDCVMIWIGPEDAAALTHLQLTFNK